MQQKNVFLNHKSDFLQKKSFFNYKKTIFSISNAFILIFSLFFVAIVGLSSAIIISSTQTASAAITSWSNYASSSAPTQDGDGYYKITTPGELAFIGNNYDTYKKAKIRLCANINLSGHTWMPITSFKGTFDGQWYTISNMTVFGNKIDYNYCGLFASLDGAIVKNTIFTGCSVNSFSKSGIVAGYAKDSTFENLTISKSNIASTYFGKEETSTDDKYVDILASNKLPNRPNIVTKLIGNHTYAGGLCGSIYNSTVYKCFVSSTNVASYNNMTSKYKYEVGDKINSEEYCSYAGGIVGYSNNSVIEVSYCNNISNYGINCKSSDDLNNAYNAYCGGIAGYLYIGSINKCYNTSPIYGYSTIGKSYNGGIAGYVTGTSSNYASITNSFNKGLIMGSAKETTSTSTLPFSTKTFSGSSSDGAVNRTGWVQFYQTSNEKIKDYMASSDITNYPSGLQYQVLGNNDDFGDTRYLYETAYSNSKKETIVNAYVGGIVGWWRPIYKRLLLVIKNF